MESVQAVNLVEKNKSSAKLRWGKILLVIQKSLVFIKNW
jgi:hypothetical protein